MARDLAARAEELREVFRLGQGKADPAIARLGLENLVIPMGHAPVFLEIVSPIRPGVTAERYLERRGGDGGYMYIIDDSNHAAAKARAQALGMRIITDRVWEDEPQVRNFQLHPKDTGGAMIEIDHHGAGEDMLGAYRWAGEGWRRHLQTECVRAVLGAEIQSEEPQAMAERWAAIFARPIAEEAEGPTIRLDNAFARFTPLADERGDGLSAIHLAVDDPGAARSRARGLGLPFAGDQPLICGVRFALSASQGPN